MCLRTRTWSCTSGGSRASCGTRWSNPYRDERCDRTIFVLRNAHPVASVATVPLATGATLPGAKQDVHGSKGSSRVSDCPRGGGSLDVRGLEACIERA